MRSFFPPRRFSQTSRGFTLVEVLISVAILSVILLSALELIAAIERSWKATSSDPFAEAENAFETIVQNVTTATLEPYRDYADANGAFHVDPTLPFTPYQLARRSDLDFVCGPSAGPGAAYLGGTRTTTGSDVFFVEPQGYTQTYAHEGMDRLLNATGYFVEFGDDDAAPPFIISTTHRWRWRLKQIQQAAESLQVYALTSSTSSASWIQGLTQATTPTEIVAENIVILLVLPEPSINNPASFAPSYAYDSRDAGNPLTRHQLPPRLRVVLVAMDAASGQILANKYGSNPPPLVPGTLFQTATSLDADLTMLDGLLSAQKINHRIFQREITLAGSAWSNDLSPPATP